MIPIIKYGEYWILGSRTIGITLYPFIFLKKSYFERFGSQKEQRLAKTINHEKIHIKQQVELLVLPFYILYFFGKDNISTQCKKINNHYYRTMKLECKHKNYE